MSLVSFLSLAIYFVGVLSFESAKYSVSRLLEVEPCKNTRSYVRLLYVEVDKIYISPLSVHPPS